MTREFIEFIKKENNDISYLNDLVTVHPIEEKIDEAYSDGHAMGIDEGEKIGLERGEEIGLERGEKIGLERGEKIGVAKGIKQGIKQGIEQGVKEGIKQGVKEGVKQERLAIAENLLKKNISIDEIIEITNLSKEQIESLK